MPNFHPNNSWSNWLLDTMIVSFWLGCIACGILIAGHYVFFPYWPCYFTALLPPENRHFAILTLYGIQYFYMLQCIWAIINIQGTFILTYGWYIFQISHEYFCFNNEISAKSQLKRWQRQKTIAGFRTIEEFPRRYRQFQILHVNFEQIFCKLIMPLEAVITFLAIFCNFSLIHHKNRLSPSNLAILLIWTVGVTGFWLTALSFCGIMYKKSAKTLVTIRKKHWGSRHLNLCMKKFVRSCHPISYGSGRMYVIRMLSTFKFIRHVSRGTFKALLTAH